MPDSGIVAPGIFSVNPRLLSTSLWRNLGLKQKFPAIEIGISYVHPEFHKNSNPACEEIYDV